MKQQTTKVAALGAIAKELNKIANELKRANEGANEPVYELTEKGKALVEQHCEEVSNKPSDKEAQAAVKTLSKYCDGFYDCDKCIFHDKENDACKLHHGIPEDWRR